MKNDETQLVVYRGHGEPGALRFHEVGGDVIGYLVANNNVNNYTDNKQIIDTNYYINELLENELASVRCVLYLGCNTATDIKGTGGYYNLIEETYKKERILC